jgi:YebC/PmpR family DNA-binding regulatory protein
MSGHSKWSKIKRKKGAEDARKGKLFTKLGRTIAVAAREGGGDPESNFTLRLAMDKAREASMPAENIERAIKRGTGELEGEGTLEKGIYGGYGPAGVAYAVDVLTDNKNRTVSELRKIFEDHGGNLAEASSVLWQFHQKGLVVVAAARNVPAEKFGEEDREERVDTDELMMEMIDIDGVEDVVSNGEEDENGFEICEVITSVKQLAHVEGEIRERGYIVDSAELVRLPEQMQEVSASAKGQVGNLIEALDDHEDVENVWTNADLEE